MKDFQEDQRQNILLSFHNALSLALYLWCSLSLSQGNAELSWKSSLTATQIWNNMGSCAWYTRETWIWTHDEFIRKIFPSSILLLGSVVFSRNIFYCKTINCNLYTQPQCTTNSRKTALATEKPRKPPTTSIFFFSVLRSWRKISAYSKYEIEVAQVTKKIEGTWCDVVFPAVEPNSNWANVNAVQNCFYRFW